MPDTTHLPEKFNTQESTAIYTGSDNHPEKEILQLLGTGIFTAGQIKERLKTSWDEKKLSSFLKKHVNVKTLPGRPLSFTLKTAIMKDLFDEES
ncbi:MAG: hypothetical protein PWR20_6 [Bacteroidales bacterium]|jgi:hypothetical protein|nr:hypothetical protein [Bacteroidales bacterium]MDN5328581.1 hypothetical protein [Bacteroidales bacterium]